MSGANGSTATIERSSSSDLYTFSSAAILPLLFVERELSMRVAAFVIVAVLMAAPVAFAQTEAAGPVVAAETVTQELATPPTSSETPTPTTSESEASEATPAPSEQLICRTGPRSESRLRSRQQVCRTQAEWEARDRANSRSGAN